MIPRYSRPKMAAIWEPANRFAIWLKIEILACEAWAELGVEPKEAVAEIKAKATFDMAALVPRIDEIERRTKHDVVAFTEAVAEQIGPASRNIHLGLTSSDILDTCLACQMQQAADLLLEDVAALDAGYQRRLAATLGVAVATWAVVRWGLARLIVPYGRRRLGITVLVGFVLNALLTLWLRNSPVVPWDLRVIGHIVPGIIANEALSQGLVPTLAATLFVAALVRLLLFLLSGWIP